MNACDHKRCDKDFKQRVSSSENRFSALETNVSRVEEVEEVEIEVPSQVEAPNSKEKNHKSEVEVKVDQNGEVSATLVDDELGKIFDVWNQIQVGAVSLLLR